MKYSIIILLGLFISCKTNRTTTNLDSKPSESLAEKLCNQFDDNIENQLKLQMKLIQEESLKNLDEKINNESNPLSEINVLNYKTTRDLRKNCSKYKIKYYALGSIFTRVLDIDNTLNNKEEDEIELKIENLEKEKKVQLMIVTIDDLYPYEGITEYSIEQGNDWNVGKYAENGGLIVVLDKNDRNIRLSTDNKLKKELTDKECEEIIEFLKPLFKEKRYTKGLNIMIDQINQRI
ncbi:TPM domain-containing protein [Pareuzebyella sediminis]|uniref:TPM domain-containing protein n=1 Tax=Pareuzebyella sediminis TaxID=2607998 RepID=UPI0011EEE5B2|nr:TPM domain-containing protein [Pareuzebyella sediminis]